MSVTVTRFWRTKEFILGGAVNLMEDELKMALLVPGFQYDSAMVSFSEAEGTELTGNEFYSVGGSIITSKSIQTVDTGKAEFWIGEMEWQYLTGFLQYSVIYSNKTVSGIVKPLIGLCDFGAELEFESTLFRFTWPEPLIRW